MIPFSDPSASYQSHKNEIDQAITRVLGSGWFVLGKEVEAFEEEFASFHGTDFHCVGVANGTDAIALALRCLGMKDGKRLLLPPILRSPLYPRLSKQAANRFLPTLTRLPDASALNP